MSSKASRICLEHGCPNTALASRYCPDHTKPREAYGGRTGTTQQWRKARARAMRRDGKQCTTAGDDGQRCPLPAVSVHHIVGVVDDPSLEYVLSNLRSVCKRHHDEADAEARHKRMAS